MYLSPTPTCLTQTSVRRTARMIPQIAYSSRVRKAATLTRRSNPSTARPTWKAELMIVPRAVCVRRLATPRRLSVLVSCTPCPLDRPARSGPADIMQPPLHLPPRHDRGRKALQVVAIGPPLDGAADTRRPAWDVID